MPGRKSTQQTLEDVQRLVRQAEYVRKLTHTDLNIVRLLDNAFFQSYIAQRLKLSRSYVHQCVKQLKEHGLIEEGRYRDPLQNRARTYTLTPTFKQLLIDNNLWTDSTYTLCTPHHIKVKYPVVGMNTDIRIDGWKFSRAKSVHVRSWKPKGPERHLFNVRVKDDVIGIEFHGKSIMAYRTNHDHIIADSVEEATRLVLMHVQEGVDLFIREQANLGTRVELGTPRLTDKPHYAFESNIAKAVIEKGGNISVAGLWMDKSPEGQGRPLAGDIETRDPVIAEMVDRGLRGAMNIESIVQGQISGAISAAIPEFVNQVDARLGPLQEELSSVSARMEENASLQSQFNQVIAVLQGTIKELSDIKSNLSPNEPVLPKEEPEGMYQ